MENEKNARKPLLGERISWNGMTKREKKKNKIIQTHAVLFIAILLHYHCAGIIAFDERSSPVVRICMYCKMSASKNCLEAIKLTTRLTIQHYAATTIDLLKRMRR